jgi:hypothetical protein
MTTNGENSPEVTEFLHERYGHKEKRGWLRSWALPALLLAILGGAWTIWSGSHLANPEIRSTLISFDSTSPTSIYIRYSVAVRNPQKNPQKNYECTLVGRDKEKNIVGEIIDKIAPGTTSVVRDVAIPTRLQAVNAAVLSCASR